MNKVFNYDKIYQKIVYDEKWKLIRTDKKECNNLSCEIEVFYNEENHKNGKEEVSKIFFSADGIVIAVFDEKNLKYDIFGDEY